MENHSTMQATKKTQINCHAQPRPYLTVDTFQANVTGSTKENSAKCYNFGEAPFVRNYLNATAEESKRERERKRN